ncbi:HAD family hydrolase [Virgibacillus halophilus]|uniref:HAD family hydrolase n=1 Tax=Tigheibacillus halophilus TaxID=361280 RepID=UPI0036272E45
MAIVTVDFDGTLFLGSSFKAMLDAGKKEFKTREWTVVTGGLTKAAASGISKGKNAFRIQFFKTFARTFKGKSKKELDFFFSRLLDIGEENINKPLVEKIKEHQEKGDTVIVLSGALEPFLAAFLHRVELDVPVISTELMFYPNGICTGETGTVINGTEKVKRVEEFIFQNCLEAQEIWAYADSKSDIPLFQFAEHPVVVNPSKDMKKIAEENDWPIFSDTGNVASE